MKIWEPNSCWLRVPKCGAPHTHGLNLRVQAMEPRLWPDHGRAWRRGLGASGARVGAQGAPTRKLLSLVYALNSSCFGAVGDLNMDGD